MGGTQGLIKVHGELDKADKAAWKSLKKEINQRRKGLEMLKERISHYESQLGQGPSEGSAPEKTVRPTTVHRPRWLWSL